MQPIFGEAKDKQKIGLTFGQSDYLFKEQIWGRYSDLGKTCPGSGGRYSGLGET